MSGCEDRRAPSAPTGRSRRTRDVTSDDLDRAVVWRVLADPREVVLPERRPRHDAEAILGEARDREVALDPAARIEHLRVRHLSDVAGDAVRAEALEEVGCPFSRDSSLRERALVEDRRGLATRDVLGADRR